MRVTGGPSFEGATVVQGDHRVIPARIAGNRHDVPDRRVEIRAQGERVTRGTLRLIHARRRRAGGQREGQEQDERSHGSAGCTTTRNALLASQPEAGGGLRQNDCRWKVRPSSVASSGNGRRAAFQPSESASIGSRCSPAAGSTHRPVPPAGSGTPHADEIERAKEKLLSDKTNAALLKAAAGSKFVASGDLKKKVMKETGESEKTVQRRILGLVELGALEVRPTGLAAYRASGLI